MGAKKHRHLIAVDIGTTSAKAILYRIGGGIEAGADREYPTHHPEPGYVEQNPDEVLQAVVTVVRELLEITKIRAESVEALTFGGIWQSMLPIDRNGRVLSRSLTWADCRALRQSETLRKQLSTEYVRERTGCSIHPMYFLPRLLWYRENAPELFARTSKFVSIKEYIMFKLYGRFAVDRSIASGTGILRMATLDWDEELLKTVGVEPEMFSPVFEPTEVLGGLNREFSGKMGLLSGTPGIIGAADGALSHLGSCGLFDDRMSITVGTGAGLRRRMERATTLQSSEAWCYYLLEGSWLLGGIVQAAGNVVKWFAENFLSEPGAEHRAFETINKFAEEVAPGADGLLFLPLLAGERCPHYRPDARGSIYGLSFSHSKKHLIRALLEGIAYRLYSVYTMLAGDADIEIVVTGGMLNSPVWMQITADFFGKRFWMPRVSETSAWGGILVGLRALGIIETPEQINTMVELGGEITPDPEIHRKYMEVYNSQRKLYRSLFELSEGDPQFPS